MKIRNLSKRQWVITSIVALVLIAALGAYFLLLRGSATVIPTSDYQVLKPKEFSSRVAVNGSVAPVKTANLYTHLTAGEWLLTCAWATCEPGPVGGAD